MTDRSEAAGPAGRTLTLVERPERYAVVRCAPEGPPPAWVVWSDPFVCVVRTAEELSLFLPEARVPEAAQAERDLRLFALQGPLPFDAYGILNALTGPLADAGLWILAMSSYDTDFLAVKGQDLETAREALKLRCAVKAA